MEFTWKGFTFDFAVGAAVHTLWCPVKAEANTKFRIRSMDNKCRTYLWQGWIWIWGWTEECGFRVQPPPSLSFPCWKKTPCSNGFHRLQFKGQVHCFLPSFTFYLSLLPPTSTLSSPSFLHISNCPQNLILAVRPCCRISHIETHTVRHSHSNIAHPREEGQGLNV